MDLTIRGAANLGRIAGAAHRVEPELRKGLLREIRTGVRPVLKEIRKEAEDTLPQRGGLAPEVAYQAKYGVRTRTFGKRAGVRVEGVWAGRHLRGIERGRLRHPLFGNREHWFQQAVRPGFFSRPLEEAKPELQAAVLKATDRVAHLIRKAGS